jgi:uncharacterized protein YdhG (YjbR/CyaY superfamily)
MKRGSRKSPEKMVANGKQAREFTDEERSAMKERNEELKAEQIPARRGEAADGEISVLEKIADMPEPDREMCKRLHALIKVHAPSLSPRTWYGMPAYALDGNVVCFFQSGRKFKTRYATLGFSDKAKLDEGSMWATSFALKELNEVEESRISALLKKALS